MRLLAVFEEGENNYSAYIPDLPGCVAAGDTFAETERLIREAAALHIELLMEEGIPVQVALTESWERRVLVATHSQVEAKNQRELLLTVDS